MTGAATALPSGLTWEQFLELLDQDEYKSAELIDGQVVVGTPSWLHQRIVATLIALMWQWIHAGGGHGEVTFNPRVQITHNRGYLPDVAWYAAERVSAEGTQPDGPPDLTSPPMEPVEVAPTSDHPSPSIRRARPVVHGQDSRRLVEPTDAETAPRDRSGGRSPAATARR